MPMTTTDPQLPAYIVSATPNPAFRRIEVSVYDPDDEKHALRKLTGYLVEQRRQ